MGSDFGFYVYLKLNKMKAPAKRVQFSWYLDVVARSRGVLMFQKAGQTQGQ